MAEIPHDAPYSLSLGDNELAWTIEIRVHIPRWPDWYETIPFRIAPQPQNDDTANPVGLQLDGEELARSSEDEPSHVASQHIADGEESTEIVMSDDIEFSELDSRVWSVRDQKDSSKLLVQAVIGLSFDFHAVLERRLLYVGAHDKHSFQDGQTFWGTTQILHCRWCFKPRGSALKNLSNLAISRLLLAGQWLAGTRTIKDCKSA